MDTEKNIARAEKLGRLGDALSTAETYEALALLSALAADAKRLQDVAAAWKRDFDVAASERATWMQRAQTFEDQRDSVKRGLEAAEAEVTKQIQARGRASEARKQAESERDQAIERAEKAEQERDEAREIATAAGNERNSALETLHSVEIALMPNEETASETALEAAERIVKERDTYAAAVEVLRKYQEACARWAESRSAQDEAEVMRRRGELAIVRLPEKESR